MKLVLTTERFISAIPKLSITFNCGKMLGSYVPYARVAICTQTKIHSAKNRYNCSAHTIVQFILCTSYDCSQDR